MGAGMSKVEVTYLCAPPREGCTIPIVRLENRHPLFSMEFGSMEQALAHPMPAGYGNAIFKDGDDRYVYSICFGWQKIVYYNQVPDSNLN